MSCQDFCPPFDHYCAVALHLVCHYYMLSSVCSAFQLSARAFSIRRGENNQKIDEFRAGSVLPSGREDGILDTGIMEYMAKQQHSTQYNGGSKACTS
mgnify:CR=1 FL=1